MASGFLSRRCCTRSPRRKILAYLSETELSAGDIATRFDMSKPSLSKHLMILGGAELVKA